ncbi:TPA: hypothetical protein ACTW9O_000666 [Raoultella ornithinolytica]
MTKSTITREQLIKKAQEQIEFCRHTKITGEGRAHVNQCAALFEIALAALDSEPVAKQVACWSCRNKVEISAIGDCDGYCPNCNSPIDLDEEPYTAPQSAQSAPVVPDEMDRIGAFDMFDSLPDGDVVDCVQYTWNACRAAMLNGGKP